MEEVISIQRVTKVVCVCEGDGNFILIKIPFSFNFHTSVVGHDVVAIRLDWSGCSGQSRYEGKRGDAQSSMSCPSFF